MTNNIHSEVGPHRADVEAAMLGKKWSLDNLDGKARSFLRQVPWSVSLAAVLGAESFAVRCGANKEETTAVIYTAIREVPNPGPDKVEALQRKFPL